MTSPNPPGKHLRLLASLLSLLLACVVFGGLGAPVARAAEYMPRENIYSQPNSFFLRSSITGLVQPTVVFSIPNVPANVGADVIWYKNGILLERQTVDPAAPTSTAAVPGKVVSLIVTATVAGQTITYPVVYDPLAIDVSTGKYGYYTDLSKDPTQSAKPLVFASMLSLDGSSDISGIYYAKIGTGSNYTYTDTFEINQIPSTLDESLTISKPPQSQSKSTGASMQLWADPKNDVLGLMRNPFGVALDSKGYVYVADTLNHSIRKISPGGHMTTVAGIDGDSQIYRQYWNSAKGAYMRIGYERYAVSGFTDGSSNQTPGSGYRTGAYSSDNLSSPLNTEPLFNSPEGLAAANFGTLLDKTLVYVADTGNNAIRKVLITSGTTTVTTLFGGPAAGPLPSLAASSFAPTFSDLKSPRGVFFRGTLDQSAVSSAAPGLFVVDSDDYTIKKINIGLNGDLLTEIKESPVSLTAGTYTVNVNALTTGTLIAPGMRVDGDGISPGTVVTQIVGGTVTISKPVPGSVDLTFSQTAVQTLGTLTAGTSTVAVSGSNFSKIGTGFTVSGDWLATGTTVTGITGGTATGGTVTLSPTIPASGSLTFGQTVSESSVALASGTALVSVSAGTGNKLFVGMNVTGEGLASNTTVTNVRVLTGGATVTLSPALPSASILTFSQSITDPTAKLENGSQLVTVSPVYSDYIYPGMTVTGVGISGTITILKVTGNTLVLSSPASLSGTSALTFSSTVVTPTTVTLTRNSKTLSVSSLVAPNIYKGMRVSGEGIASGTKVTAVSGATITISTAIPAVSRLTFSATFQRGPVTLTAGTAQISLAALAAGTSNIQSGMTVAGVGFQVPAGTTVSTVTGGTLKTVTLSNKVLASTKLTFRSATTKPAVNLASATGQYVIALPVSTGTSGITTGMTVTGEGISTGTTVTAISGGSVTLSKQALTGVVTFGSVVTDTGTLVAGTSAVTVSSTDAAARLSPGMSVRGNGIASGTTVSAVDTDTGTVTLSKAVPTSLNLTFSKSVSAVGTLDQTQNGKLFVAGGTVGMSLGMSVFGEGVMQGTTVTAITGNTLTLSKNTPPLNPTSAFNSTSKASTGTLVQGILTAGTNTITLSGGATGLSVGMTLTGNFLNAGTKINAINSGTSGSSIVINGTATGSGASNLFAAIPVFPGATPGQTTNVATYGLQQLVQTTGTISAAGASSSIVTVPIGVTVLPGMKVNCDVLGSGTLSVLSVSGTAVTLSGPLVPSTTTLTFGQMELVAGNDKIPGWQGVTVDATAANFYTPRGLVVDDDETIYVADTVNHVIRMLSKSSGAWTARTIAGFVGSRATVDGIGTDARLAWPEGLALDSARRILYFSEWGSHSIRRIILPLSVDAAGNEVDNPYVGGKPNWTVDSVAGTGSYGPQGSTDGTGLGSAASFYWPGGLAFDATNPSAEPMGSVFVADSANHVIRKVKISDSSTTLGKGISSTFAGVVRVGGNRDYAERPEYTYQWWRNAMPISNGQLNAYTSTVTGADTDTLLVTGLQYADAGAYTLKVTNTFDVFRETPPASVYVDTKDTPKFKAPGYHLYDSAGVEILDSAHWPLQGSSVSLSADIFPADQVSYQWWVAEDVANDDGTYDWVALDPSGKAVSLQPGVPQLLGLQASATGAATSKLTLTNLQAGLVGPPSLRFKVVAYAFGSLTPLSTVLPDFTDVADGLAFTVQSPAVLLDPFLNATGGTYTNALDYTQNVQGSLSVVAGDTITLTLPDGALQGFPDPVVTWMRKSTLGGTAVSTGQTGTIFTLTTSGSSKGYYFASVANGVGTSLQSWAINLRVQTDPYVSLTPFGPTDTVQATNPANALLVPYVLDKKPNASFNDDTSLTLSAEIDASDYPSDYKWSFIPSGSSTPLTFADATDNTSQVPNGVNFSAPTQVTGSKVAMTSSISKATLQIPQISDDASGEYRLKVTVTAPGKTPATQICSWKVTVRYLPRLLSKSFKVNGIQLPGGATSSGPLDLSKSPSAQLSAQFKLFSTNTTFSYAWRKNLFPVTIDGVKHAVNVTPSTGKTGNKTIDLNLNEVASSDVGTYRLEVTNDLGTVILGAYSAGEIPASLVSSDLAGWGIAASGAPSISVQPSVKIVSASAIPSVSVAGTARANAGQQAAIQVVVSANPTPDYVWQYSKTTGATASWSSIDANVKTANAFNKSTGTLGSSICQLPILTADQSGYYRVTVTNKLGSVQSKEVQLTVDGALDPIVGASSLTTVAVGGRITLSALSSLTRTVFNASAYTFQWKKDGMPILGATDATYTLTSAKFGDSGSYTVVVTGSGVTKESAKLALSIVTASVYSTTTNTLWPLKFEDTDKLRSFSYAPRLAAVAAGTRVTLTGTPFTNEMVLRWSVKDSAGNVLAVLPSKNAGFIMPATAVTVTPYVGRSPAGIYSGLLSLDQPWDNTSVDTEWAWPSSAAQPDTSRLRGYIRCTITSLGSVSGQISLENKTYAFVSALDQNLKARFSISTTVSGLNIPWVITGTVALDPTDTNRIAGFTDNMVHVTLSDALLPNSLPAISAGQSLYSAAAGNNGSRQGVINDIVAAGASVPGMVGTDTSTGVLKYTAGVYREIAGVTDVKSFGQGGVLSVDVSSSQVATVLLKLPNGKSFTFSGYPGRPTTSDGGDTTKFAPGATSTLSMKAGESLCEALLRVTESASLPLWLGAGDSAGEPVLGALLLSGEVLDGCLGVLSKDTVNGLSLYTQNYVFGNQFDNTLTNAQRAAPFTNTASIQLATVSDTYAVDSNPIAKLTGLGTQYTYVAGNVLNNVKPPDVPSFSWTPDWNTGLLQGQFNEPTIRYVDALTAYSPKFAASKTALNCRYYSVIIQSNFPAAILPNSDAGGVGFMIRGTAAELYNTTLGSGDVEHATLSISTGVSIDTPRVEALLIKATEPY